MIEMRCTPIVIGILILRSLSFWWEVMEQTSFCGCRCLDHMLKVTRFVFWNLLFSVPIACLGHENCGVDNQPTKVFESLLKAWNSCIRRPEVRTQILGEILSRKFRCRFGAWEGGINVESTICIKWTFICVDLAVLECLLSTRPAC